MTKKRKLSGEVPARVVPAPPGSDPPLAWLLEMVERVGGEDADAARVAGNNLNEIVGNLFSYILGFALREGDSKAKQWSGEHLAWLQVTLEKHHKKLSKTNPAYLKEKKKLGKLRTDVLFPKAARRVGVATLRRRFRRTLDTRSHQ